MTPVQHVFEDPDPFGSTGSFPLDSQGPVHSTPAPTLTDEQQRRIKLNKQLALERRLARKQPPTGKNENLNCRGLICVVGHFLGHSWRQGDF